MGQAPAERPPHEFHFTTGMVWSPDALDREENVPEPLEFEYLSGEQWRSLTVSYMATHGRFRYRGPSPLRLYRASVGADGEKTRRLALSVEIPPEISEGILYFFPPQNDTYYGHLVDTSLSRFKPGELLVANFSPNRAVAGIFEERVVIPPGSSEVIPFESGRTFLDFQVAVQENQAWRLIANRRFPAVSNRRAVALIYQSDITGGPWKMSLSFLKPSNQ